MDKNEQRMRITCDAACVLIYKGVNYQGAIENVSLTGALIKMSNNVSADIYSGDDCGLMLSSSEEECPTKYICQIIRHDAAYIGVRFIELTS